MPLVEYSRTIQNFLESSYHLQICFNNTFVGNVLTNVQKIEIIAKIDRAANHNGLHKRMCHYSKPATKQVAET